MRNGNQIRVTRKNLVRVKFGKIMQCFCSGEQSHRRHEKVASSESLATKDYATSVYSSQAGDTGNIEEAETSLRESGSLNYEEARALLGRYEYQKGNIEAAVHVFEGIDIVAVTPKMKITLSKQGVNRRRRSSQNYEAPPMSMHAVNLLFEASFLKAKCLQALGRYKEAAQSCSVILDIVESSLAAGLPENFGPDCKLQETVNKAVELLPELWKLADSSREAILAYRRALLHHWNLDAQITAKIQKGFAIFLLYSGAEAIPPNLRSQMESSFVPKNNIEEAILLLIILLRKVALKRIEWDPSILDHLCYALSISGGLRDLAHQVEELPPGVMDSKEMYHILALCYHGEGDDLDALNLWEKMLKTREDSTHLPALLFVSKICGGESNSAEDGISFANRASENLHGKCDQLMGVANCMLGISLSAKNCKSVVTDSERVEIQSATLKALEIAGRMTKMKDPTVVYHLCQEYAEQRKLDIALQHVKKLLKLEGGSNLRGWILLARILSAQKNFEDAEIIINMAIDQCGVWDRGELLRTKAKLQIALGLVNEAIETYSQLLGVIQLQSKSFGLGKKLKERRDYIKNLELETWHDLASIYIRLSRWHDAELCLSKSEAISPFSASRWHSAGMLHEARGQDKEALKAYGLALEIDPTHVPSLVSTAAILRKIGCQPPAIIRSFLTEAVRHDRENASAWHNLGLLYKEGESLSVVEAAECFQAAIFLEETEPVEPFR